MQSTELRNFDYRKYLTYLLSGFNVLGVARFKDIIRGLSAQTLRKSDELTKDREEMNKLRDAYQRYRELSEQADAKERTLKIGLALLLCTPTKDDLKDGAYIRATHQAQEAFGVPVESRELELSAYSLWRVIREVVRQAGTLRVFELEEHLRAFGVKATRPAIESALTTHSKEFRITKNGREKFVSLKGA